MPKRYADQTHTLYAGAIRSVGVDFQRLIGGDEILTGTPQVSDAGGVFAISRQQVTIQAMTMNRRNVPAGKGAVFIVDRNGADVGEYEIDIVVTTSEGQTIPVSVRINCV